MAGALRLLSGALRPRSDLGRGGRRVERHASSPTTRANCQARLHGRRMDARSRSTAAALAHRFASGSLTPMAAPRDRSQAGPATTRCQRGPRDGKWIYFAHERGATRDIWRVPSRGGQPQQVTRTGSGFVAYELDGGTSLLYQPVNGDSALLLLSLTGDAEHRGSSSTASDRRRSLQQGTQWSTCHAIRAQGHHFAPSIPSAERTVSLGDSRIFLRGGYM